MKKFLVLLVFAASAHASIKDDNLLLEYILDGSLDWHFFVDHHVDLDQLLTVGPYEGVPPLVVAIMHNRPQALRAMLEVGASPNKLTVRGESPLEIAVGRAPLDVTKLLLSYGATITPQLCHLAGARPELFHLLVDEAVHRQVPEAVQVLNELLIGARSQHQLALLLASGAHADYKNTEGVSALDAVMDTCNPGMLSHMLAVVGYAPTPAAVERLKLRCGSCEHHACDCCLAKGVLERGACRNLADGYKELARHIAGHTLTKQFLDQYFAGTPRLNINRTLQPGSDMTALKLAVTHDNQPAIVLLFAYGARMSDELMRYALGISPRATLKILVKHGARFFRIPNWPKYVIGINPHAKAIVRWMAPVADQATLNSALDLALKHNIAELPQFLVDLGAWM